MDRRDFGQTALETRGGLQRWAGIAVAIAMVVGPFVSPLSAGDLNDRQASITPSQTLDLAGLQDQFKALSSRLSPSVVAISATTKASAANGLLQADQLNADQLAVQVFDKTTRLVGTGFVIDAGGYLLTNDHVIAEAEQLWVTTDDRKVYPAFVVAADARTDLAVLKIPAVGLTPVRFAKEAAQRGQWSIAVGNPYGLSSDGEMCMSVGIVSGVNRSLPKLASSEGRLYSSLIQTTAEINPGNSGGPLFNLNGEVIGINTAVVLPQRQTSGIGFAIPTDRDVLKLVNDLKDGREVVHGFLGVTVSQPTPANRSVAGLVDGGARIDSVDPKSPAGEVAMQAGDIVAAINGQVVRDGDHLVRQIALADVGKPISLTVHRAGGLVDSIEVQLLPRAQSLVADSRPANRMRWGGLLVGAVPSHWASSGERGVMVLSIDKSAGAIPSGVTIGTIITTVAGKPVTSLIELQRILNETPAEKCSVQVAERRDAVTSASRE